ncbi:ComEA family DNA-binding protein [Litoribacter populi]|uniref:ComEA family DNA-binding protein n=1 Tax=Litoribacter populi TaxID=2598460 RepID=UPI00117EAD8B|nr:helix-hairpin-helix domain-containing protein [Litoribacter populi]
MFKKLHFYLRVYLGFSKREARGFALLIPFLIIFYTTPILYERIVLHDEKAGYANWETTDTLNASLNSDSTFRESLGHLAVLTAGKDSLPKSVRRQVDYGNVKLGFAETDSITLQVVPGIGKAMASRIIKFRDSMGGLHSKEQLLEVYGLEEAVYDRIWEHFEFRPTSIEKLPINSAPVDLLSKHPYISFGQAKVIIAYREQHGPYRSVEDLLAIKILNPNWVQRLKPYLSFE